MGLLIAWLVVGYVSTVASIIIFRGQDDGQYKKPRGRGRPMEQTRWFRATELVFAATGPFFGPVVLVMLVLDLIRDYRFMSHWRRVGTYPEKKEA